MKPLKVLLLILLITGCATTAKMEAKLESWVGKSADALIDSWGYPVSTIEAPNGNTVYKYSESFMYIPPNSMVGYNMACDISFELSPRNEVIKWAMRGDGCTSW